MLLFFEQGHISRPKQAVNVMAGHGGAGEEEEEEEVKGSGETISRPADGPQV